MEDTDMKKAIKLFSAVVLLGGMIFTTGCDKQNGMGQSGKLITFGTSALTRTEYGGKTNDASGIEPIWWTSSDKVVIVSDKAIVTNTNDQNWATYKFSSYVEENKSHAKVENDGTNGLAWVDGENTYNFYAGYPSGMNIGKTAENMGKVTAEIPTPQEIVAHEYSVSDASTVSGVYPVSSDGKYTVYEPSMEYALMTASTEGVANGTSPVQLTFHPAFTAFEFTFESADPEVDINLTEFRMESTSTALAGVFTGKAGDETFTAAEGASKTLSLSNPSAIGTVKNGEPKSFTIFAMPQELTDLSIYFADKDADNTTRTRVLHLNDKDGKALKFAAGHKYRIHGLKLPGNQYQFFLTLNGVAQDWVIKDMDTIFSEQVQCTALTFDKSAREMTDEYIAQNGKTNHYQNDSPVGDGRWQVRTLNNAGLDGETYDYFTVTFTPSAPLGGYWKLDTHGNEYFTVQVVGKPGAVDEEITDLPEAGRVMNQMITLRITPNWTKINEAPSTTEIGLYFDCYFSTNLDFDPALDANTEFQDIHGAGTYSYWLLTVERQ